MRKAVVVALASFAGACSQPVDVAPPDLAVAAPDLALTVDLAMPDLVPPVPAVGFVIAALTVPSAGGEYAIDLDGDGQIENQFGLATHLLDGQGVGLQSSLDINIASGLSVELVALLTRDGTLTADPAAAARFTPAVPTAPVKPDLSGRGAFTPDTTPAPTSLGGALAAKHFESDDPMRSRSPLTLVLPIPMFVNEKALLMPIQAATVRFDIGADAVTGLPTIRNGQINGCVLATDVERVFVPPITATLNGFCARDPGSLACVQIIGLLDMGGCPGATYGDGRLEPCEVWTNPVSQMLIGPDMDLFDKTGEYAPGKGDGVKDCLSFGIGFSAVRASY